VRRQSVDPQRVPAGVRHPGRRRGGPQSVLALQRAAGNQAVAGLLRTPAGGAPSGAPAQTKPLFLVTIKAQKQGLIKGGGPGNAIEGLKYGMGVTSPKDAATGQSSGRRIHKAITFTKPWDAASPQLMSAADDNELLTEVTFSWTKASATGGGEQVPFQTVTLNNASVASFDQQSDENGNVDVVTLTYETIQMDNDPGKTSAKDEWVHQNN